jgi:hypothetical protein
MLTSALITVDNDHDKCTRFAICSTLYGPTYDKDNAYLLLVPSEFLKSRSLIGVLAHPMDDDDDHDDGNVGR